MEEPHDTGISELKCLDEFTNCDDTLNNTLEIDAAMDNHDTDDEVFFGPVSSKELQKIESLEKWKTNKLSSIKSPRGFDDTITLSEYGEELIDDLNVSSALNCNSPSQDCDYEIVLTSGMQEIMIGADNLSEDSAQSKPEIEVIDHANVVHLGQESNANDCQVDLSLKSTHSSLLCEPSHSTKDSSLLCTNNSKDLSLTKPLECPNEIDSSLNVEDEILEEINDQNLSLIENVSLLSESGSLENCKPVLLNELDTHSNQLDKDNSKAEEPEKKENANTNVLKDSEENITPMETSNFCDSESILQKISHDSEISTDPSFVEEVHINQSIENSHPTKNDIEANTKTVNKSQNVDISNLNLDSDTSRTGNDILLDINQSENSRSSLQKEESDTNKILSTEQCQNISTGIESNKMSCLLKEKTNQRLSYFSSLETIDVNNSKLYGSFIDIPEEREVQKYDIDQCNDSKISLISSFEGSPSRSNCEEFVNPQNLGMVYSSTNTSSGFCEPTITATKDITDNNSANLSLVSSHGAITPKRVFNDTIEEMELMLKYGEKYFETKSHNESIVSPQKESSVHSTITNFDPNFDSTRKSNEISETNATYIDERFPVPNVNVTPPRNCPPPKPPRIDVEDTQSPKQICPSSGHSANRTRSVFHKNLKSPSCIPKLYLTPQSTHIKLTTGSLPRKINTTPQKDSNLRTTPQKDSNLRRITPQKESNIRRINTTPKKDSKVLVASKNFLSQQVKPQQKLTTHTPQLKRSPQTVKTPQRLAPKYSSMSARKVRTVVAGKSGPIAKYLQNNPPPPLITNVTPRCIISPQKMRDSKFLLANMKPANFSEMHQNLDDTMAQRNENMDKIDDKMDELHMKLQILQESNEISNKAYSEPPKSKIRSVLPFSSYCTGQSLKLEEKENLDRRRDIITNKPPPTVTKHIGRVKIPRNKSPNPVDKTRVSMMEVSLYEPHSVHHTNTISSVKK